MFPGSGDQKDLGRYLAIGQIGMEMAAPIALGALIDSYFGCSPWAVSIGAVVGFIGGFAQLVRVASKRPPPAGRARSRPADDVRPGDTP
jgi:F0F1-type ATP synthase assembly protein I